MTPERTRKVVEKLKAMAGTNFSDYAGFHFEGETGKNYIHKFIVNDQKDYSSNFTLELENISDAVNFIQQFKGQSRKKTFIELENTEYYEDKSPLFLHYVKLLKES